MQSTNETVRTESLDMLTMLKEQREKIDVHISNLLEEEEDDKIKKYVRSTMRGDIINIKIKFEDCLEENCKGTSVPCESCGADKVDEMRGLVLSQVQEEGLKRAFARKAILSPRFVKLLLEKL